MDNHAADPTPTILAGDCLEHLAKLAPDSIDAIVTDPPYGLGFMGKAWDELPPGPEWAEACLRVLKPGGHLLAFGGTRTWHRLAVAVEDAGFEIRDSIAWLYGSGFPKSLDVSKSIDKYAPTTPDAERWQGWGTALKPAFEPVVVARKPLACTVAANVLAHGTGALNIDGCRIGSESTRRSNTAEMGCHGGNLAAQYRTGSDAGRWPANVVLDDTTAAILDEQSGHSKSPTKVTRGPDRNPSSYGLRTEPEVAACYGDSGGASRFFYVAKAPKRERPNVDGVQHPTVKPLALMRWLVRLVTPPGGIVLDPFAGSGTTIEAALLEGFDVIGIERELTYLPLVSARVERAQHERREHGIGRKLEDR